MNNRLNCHKCGAPLERGMKFCIHCGAKVSDQEIFRRQSQDITVPKTSDHGVILSPKKEEARLSGIEVIKGKAQWKIQPGVIAQRISPSDFENLNNVTGIIIQKGVSAIIYVDGYLVSELKGGTYDFISKEAIENLLNQKATLGIVGTMKKAFNSLAKIISGKRVKDIIDETTHDNTKLKSFDDVVRRIQPTSTIDVYLKSDAPFSVIFGSTYNPNGEITFSPIRVMCQRLTADVAVSLQMQIIDFNEFISEFLVRSNVVTSYDIVQYMTPYVKAILMNRLRNVNIDEYGIPNSIRADIESMLKAHISVPGLKITQIREITSSNADFARLRSIADELFISEKELEFAMRTNEFRNRLVNIENSKKIDEAKTALELHKTLSEINKDQALHEDELDEFYLLLSRQKKIREAKSEQEVRTALNDLAKLDLLKDEEMDALTVELLSKKSERDSIAEIMMMQSMSNVELKRLFIEENLANQRQILDKTNQRNAHDLHKTDVINNIEIDELTSDYETKKTLKGVRVETDILKVKLEQQMNMDQYGDDRFNVELTHTKSKAELELELERKRRQLDAEEMERLNRHSMDIFAQWAEEDERKAQNDHNRTIEHKTIDYGHEENIANMMNTHDQKIKTIEIENRKVSATMSAEQLMAEQAANLDSGAQKSLAESIGGLKYSQAENRMREREIEEARRREELLKIEAGTRERQLREDQRNFFNQLSSDRDSMMQNMKEMMGLISGVKNKADEYSIENRNLHSRLSDTERHVSYRDNVITDLNDRLRHEEERNDNTYAKVLQHEERLQDNAINMIKTNSAIPQDTMICPSCGENVKKWKFCSKCGAELNLNK